MKNASARLRHDLLLPGLVALVGAGAALASWALLVGDRRELLLESSEETAADTREAIELELARQLATLRGLAELWQTFGLRPVDEWTADMDQRVDQIPGLTSVAWVDFDEPRRRVAAGKRRSAREIELDIEQARRAREGPEFAGPERDASGRLFYRVFLPVETPRHDAGVLVGRFHVDPLLRSLLRARARGYAVAVYWGEAEIFSRGEPSTDPWQRWWRVEGSVSLPDGGAWRVVHFPTPAFAAARLTPLPHYLLAGGILLAGLLAVAVHQLRVILRQSRFLAATNRALEQRGLELEARVGERTEELREAIAELEAFNFSVSHDLRSPLSAILNFTAILEEDFRERPLDAEGLALVSRIHRSASRATALLEDLLQLSRAGRSALSLERLDVAALARETFAQVRAAEGDPEVELLVERLPEAMADHDLLGNVFANLFSNALKYSRGREKRCVRVSGRVDGDDCLYEVSDNGQGFEMRFADKLFGLFERLHSAEEIEGTGVGLAMVARIVKRHGGRVWAEGRPGEGARFGFAIPRRAEP